MSDVAIIAYPGQKIEIALLRKIQASGLTFKVFREFDDLSEIARSKSFLVSGALNQRYNYNLAAITAEHDLSQLLIKESKKLKPILGIGFGSDILVNIGLIPGENDLKIKIGVTRKKNDSQAISYKQDIHRVASKHRTPFTHFVDSKIINLALKPIQSQFISQDPEYYLQLWANKQIVFEYTPELQTESNEINPLTNVAGICNAEGNILAFLSDFHQALEEDTQIFESLKYHLDNKVKIIPQAKLETKILDYSISPYQKEGELILLEESSPALDRLNSFLKWYLGKNVQVKEYIHYELLNADLSKVRSSEALLTPNTLKEISNLDPQPNKLTLVVQNTLDLSGQSLTEELSIENHVAVATIKKSILWVIQGLSPEARTHLLQSGLLFNPNYQKLSIYNPS